MAVSPPPAQSLPLTALRAFEAAARLGGFSAAAQELGVTPGAVSAQIKSLEDALQAQLFHRRPKQVTLTPIGARVLPEFSAAFDQLNAATRTLREEAQPCTVHIATLPAIAQFWLSPRLPALRAAMPEMVVSVTATEEPPNLKRTPYDLCLFFGGGQGEVIDQDVIFPVCAPALAEQLRTPADLQNVPCLSDAVWVQDWEYWLQAACPGETLHLRGPEYSLYSLAVEETVNGAGVLIGHQALVAPLLDSGKLVAPFAVKAELPRELRLWSLRPSGPRSPAARVARWLAENG
ncbi:MULTISPECIES: LysR family transcriptional regulator [unclassified Leisingera]|uniref:LysR family transcriptional regulator n=2 Tax=Leisingera TaxID=191028 RepID=UPI0002DC417B|nr:MULTISPECIES: LysR family transcriptional regulator [unclassified Leisingera]KIC23404.1 LysR family transcriptional regulator [Leisingera sp. ANG-S3]KIC54885.1 LysR family transcriptional regulator [Leisingera sp. ANG-S]KID08582.1 LysR family transcriptional regulator [Leisingera sp. ANG1]